MHGSKLAGGGGGGGGGGGAVQTQCSHHGFGKDSCSLPGFRNAHLQTQCSHHAKTLRESRPRLEGLGLRALLDPTSAATSSKPKQILSSPVQHRIPELHILNPKCPVPKKPKPKEPQTQAMHPMPLQALTLYNPSSPPELFMGREVKGALFWSPVSSSRCCRPTHPKSQDAWRAYIEGLGFRDV